MNLSSDPALERLLPEGLSIQEAVVDADRGLRWAFVRLPGVPAEPTPAAPAMLETRRGAMVPHVVGLAPGQSLEWTNRDALGHRIRSEAARPKPGLDLESPAFEREGLGVRLRCDIHPWELADVCVVPHSC